MLEVMQFIFSDIWHFIGTCILLEIVFGGLQGMFSNVTKIINKH